MEYLIDSVFVSGDYAHRWGSGRASQSHSDTCSATGSHSISERTRQATMAGMKTRLLIFAIISMVTLAGETRAEVGDPTIRTDHPQYAGEGAFQSVEDCVAFATAGHEGEQDRALALYRWLLTHQYHLASPQECVFPGQPVDTANGSSERVVYDANRARFSYGYGLCGTVHAWNEPYWRALGMPARRRAFPGHTNSEVFYSGSWHAFDTDMAGLLVRPDGVVAGYEDIIADPSLVDAVRPPLPHYPFVWPADFETMKRGWEQVAAGGNWYKLYNGGYAAHPGIVHLRSGETWTRWFDRDHYGGPKERRFWHNGQGGPFRDWTFVNTGSTDHDGASAQAVGNASYCNGDFVYRPDLSNPSFREGVFHASGNLESRLQSPRLHTPDGDLGVVVFSHFSPYVICGKPVDGANPMTGEATDGMILCARVVGEVHCRLSADGGQTWVDMPLTQWVDSPQEPSPRSRAVQVDLTQWLKGHYGWLIGFSWKGDAGIDELEFTTTTQVSQSIYPRLKPGGTELSYRAGSRAVTPMLPNFSLPEQQIGVFEEVSLRSQNLVYKPLGEGTRLAYETTNNQPASVVFRIDSPRPLEQVRGAFQYSIRSPSPKNSEFSMEVSVDEGKSWQAMARAEIAEDNEFSSGWLAGELDLSESDVKTALVRCRLYAGGYPTGLLQAQFYGVQRTSPPQRLEISYGWSEAGHLKTWRGEVDAGVGKQAFHVPTGEQVSDRFVRFHAR